MKNFRLEDSVYQIHSCPLCGSCSHEHHPNPEGNLYSEKIANLLKTDEATLFETFSNIACQDCGLIYKRNWFIREVLIALFNDLVPRHPRGWDAISDRFSAKNFYNELDIYAEAIKKDNIESINRYRRALTSIIDSIQDKDLHFEKEDAIKSICNSVLTYFEEHRTNIEKSFGKPEPFKRFAGFSSNNIWEYINNTAGKISQYAEIGCPLWGMLQLSVNKGVSTSVIAKQESNFWTDKCQTNGITCFQKCFSLAPKISMLTWDELLDNKLDLLGIFQYIDHLADPKNFFNEAFKRSGAVLIVIEEGCHTPPAIQHFTGWTPHVMEEVARMFGKRLDKSFTDTQKVGNSTFLFY